MRYLVNDAGCWEWQGALDRDGYGVITLYFPSGRVTTRAHRTAYMVLVGAIPQGLTLDHLCRNRRCINPEHLEPVTNAENVLRGDTITARNRAKTHCAQGHPFDDENTYPHRDGKRGCRACRRMADRKHRSATRAGVTS